MEVQSVRSQNVAELHSQASDQSQKVIEAAHKLDQIESSKETAKVAFSDSVVDMLG